MTLTSSDAWTTGGRSAQGQFRRSQDRGVPLDYAGMALRVLLADDNFLVREGVAALLAQVPELVLVDAVADPQALLESVAEHHPDVVLTDIRMPPSFTSEGIDAAKRIRADHPSIGVILLLQYV